MEGLGFRVSERDLASDLLQCLLHMPQILPKFQTFAVFPGKLNLGHV